MATTESTIQKAISKRQPQNSKTPVRMRKNVLIALIASLTLGLAPFVPEPHLFGKIKWVLGGAEGMSGEDWFDLLMHGAPFLWLAYELIMSAVDYRKSKNPV